MNYLPRFVLGVSIFLLGITLDWFILVGWILNPRSLVETIGIFTKGNILIFGEDLSFLHAIFLFSFEAVVISVFIPLFGAALIARPYPRTRYDLEQAQRGVELHEKELLRHYPYLDRQ